MEFRILLRLALGAVLLASGPSVAWGATNKPSSTLAWPEIPAAERTAGQPSLEADAPAEILEWTWDVDERRYPDYSREEEYLRVKIFDPAAATDLTRLAGLVSELTKTEITARLTLPDGTVREFGKESVKEKDAVKIDLFESKERFLAVPGVVAGAIVELRRVTEWGVELLGPGWSWWEAPDGYMSTIALQRLNAPVKRASMRWRFARDDFFDSRLFIVNAQAKVERTGKELKLIAENLPSRVDEPHLGPATDYTATAIRACTSTRLRDFAAYQRAATRFEFDTEAGEWAPFASNAARMVEARTWPTSRMKKLVAELAAGETDPVEKARRIHAHVQKLFIDFDRKAQAKAAGAANGDLTSLDLLLDPAGIAKLRIAPIDYFWLCVAMYRAAGLDASVALLPDRKLARFHPSQVAQGFLPHLCAVIKVGQTHHFSYPTASQPALSGSLRGPLKGRNFLPFGQLPWNTCGQVALLGQVNKQEFIPVPPLAAEQSKIATFGVFRLDAQGTLVGQARRQFTGLEAARVRAELFDESDGKRREFLLKEIKAAMPDADVEITKLNGVDEPAAAIELECKLTWPSFATPAGDRLIFRPSIFRRERPSEFSAEKRRHPVHFPFPFEHTDSLGIQVPAGFKPEALPEPAALPGGKALNVGVKVNFDETRRLLTVRRDYSSSILDVPAEAYPNLKAWFDALAALDQQEIVLVSSGTPAGSP